MGENPSNLFGHSRFFMRAAAMVLRTSALNNPIIDFATS